MHKLALLLYAQKLSVYQCAKSSGIPYTTLLDLVKGKTQVEKCSAETLYRLSSALNMTMDDLYRHLHTTRVRPAFETFKSNLCHIVREKGDLEFIIETLESDDIGRYWKDQWYLEAYYTLAMVDYLSRLNQLPLCEEYDSIRTTSLKDPVFPRDIELAARLDPSLNVKEQAIAESIPEFIRFNIVEKEIRNVC